MTNPRNNDLTNTFRDAVSVGRPLIGIWSMLNSTNAVEGLAWSGFDWLLIDGEHAPVTLADAMAQMRTLAATPTIPVVRLAWNDSVLLKQYLDAGATTVMLPYVQHADEAVSAVRAMRYPPRGERGVAAMHRASRYGRVRDYVKRADENLYLIVQIETRQALEHLDSILAVDGVDAVFFGPGDLAASMGIPGQADHPDVTAEIEKGLARVRRTAKAAGVLAPNATIAERHTRSGFDFVSVASDCALLFGAADAAAARFRSVAQGEAAKATA
jgi:4-hydroxy-2-oxoheptanedioate aldolase